MSGARITAAHKGEVRYIGEPCRKCGGVERYTATANCCACMISRANKQRQNVREILRAARAARETASGV